MPQGGKRQNSGRKKKSEEERLHTISARIPKKDRENIITTAKEKGMSLGKFILSLFSNG